MIKMIILTLDEAQSNAPLIVIYAVPKREKNNYEKRNQLFQPNPDVTPHLLFLKEVAGAVKLTVKSS